MKRHARATTYNLADANDLARWERVHCYQPSETLSAVLWREFSEVERVWRLDPAQLDAYRRDLQRHTAALDALERVLGNQLNAINDPRIQLHRLAASMVLQRAAAEPLMQAAHKVAAARAAGGRARASQPPSWHADAVSTAKGILAIGGADHNLAGMIARRLGRSDDSVRVVLQRAGVLPPRKTRKR